MRISPLFTGRVLFTSEICMSALNGIGQLIEVPLLRVREEDLGDWILYMVRLQSPGLDWGMLPVVPDAVVHRLQNRDFANNLRELESLVDRALRQARQQTSATGLPTILPEEMFWTGQRSQNVRFDLWRWEPELRKLMRAPQLWISELVVRRRKSGAVAWTAG